MFEIIYEWLVSIPFQTWLGVALGIGSIATLLGTIYYADKKYKT